MDSDLYLYLKNIHRRISFLFFFDNSTARSLRSLSLPRPHPLVLAVNKSTGNFQDARKTPWSLKIKYSVCIQKRLWRQNQNYKPVRIHQAPVVQKLDSTIRRINHYAVDKYYKNRLHYPLDSDLSGG